MTDRLRLTLWIGFVGLLATAAYVNRATEGKPAQDVLYQWSTAVGGVASYLIVGAVALAIASGRRGLLGLRRPHSWTRAARLALGVLVGVLVVGPLLDSWLHAGEEQGYTPSGWDASRAHQYVANVLVIALLAPVVEEVLFRGIGYGLLRRLGRWPAIVFVGLAFGLVHGLVAGLVVLWLFGSALAWLRARTDSVLPGIVVHSLFNGVALIAAVTT